MNVKNLFLVFLSIIVIDSAIPPLSYADMLGAEPAPFSFPEQFQEKLLEEKEKFDTAIRNLRDKPDTPPIVLIEKGTKNMRIYRTKLLKICNTILDPREYEEADLQHTKANQDYQNCVKWASQQIDFYKRDFQHWALEDIGRKKKYFGLNQEKIFNKHFDDLHQVFMYIRNEFLDLVKNIGETVVRVHS